jgi:phosphate transport system substrate-binding protein
MTSFDILTAAFRTLASSRNHPEVKISWMTSGAVADQLVDVHENLGFMSVAMSSAEKEKFYRSSGFPITEFHYAHDAIEVLVHADNPVRSLTVPQLDAIFGAELRAGAPAAISDWSAVGGSAGTIRFLGGGPNSGTTRMFQQSILKGGKFRSSLEHSDVVTPNGIEADVANDPTAIGFVTLRPRRNGVRALAVAPNSGERAAQVSAEDVYSGRYPLQRLLYGYVTAPNLNAGGAYERELVNLLLSDVGQTLVARVGELPLTANEVIAQRSKLDLPQ